MGSDRSPVSDHMSYPRFQLHHRYSLPYLQLFVRRVERVCKEEESHHSSKIILWRGLPCDSGHSLHMPIASKSGARCDAEESDDNLSIVYDDSSTCS
jgi:hypothetical protein